tara:strand:+ start:163 stop:510 length:348 start_codon:yes stop_codon:yes gene_type:complete
MKYVKIKKICVTAIVLFVTAVINAQTESISIVQYTASFAQEISLDDYKDYNVETLFMSNSKKLFDKNKIQYLPTVILYNDGEEELRIEGNIRLELPGNWKQLVNEHIDLLLEQRF